MARRLAVVLAGLTLVVVAPASRTEEAAKKPLGTWERKVGDQTLQMQVKADGLVFKISDGSKTIEVSADYGITKTGILFGHVSKVKLEGTNDGPAEGHLFSFQFSVDKDTLTIKELKGTDNAEARQLVEGDYKKVS